MSNTIDALQHAIEYLGAVEVGPGSDPHHAFNRYAVSSPSGRWHTFSQATLATFAEGALNHYRYQVTIGRAFVLMPFWWTPEQRFAWRLRGQGQAEGNLAYNRWPTLDDAVVYFDGRISEIHFERVTVNLETGEELPA